MTITILRRLSPPDGVAPRGSLLELGRRLYWTAGECGPLGAARCNSTANWQTLVHTRQCPGALCSIQLDGSDFRVDHAFTTLEEHGQNQDGYHPYGSLAAGPDGMTLYGVTQMGGLPTAEAGQVGAGVLFSYDVARQAFTTLHHFGSEARGFDGMNPMGQVAVDEHGSVFGTAHGGGANGVGTVWQWSPGGAFRYTAIPAGIGETYGGLALAGGDLHGTAWTGTDTTVGGSYFVVDRDTLAVTWVWPFEPAPRPAHADDNTPIQAPLLMSDGRLVVAREFGGPRSTGVLARLDRRAGVLPIWTFDDLGPIDVAPRFANATGAMPNGNLCEGRDGMVYGCAQYGGANGTGGIYRVARDGSLFELLHSFDIDAGYPYGGPICASDGNLYGTTFTGLVWRMTLPVAP